MHRIMLCCLAACVLLLRAAPASAQLTLYHDRSAFEAAIAGLGQIRTDDYEAYPPGDIALGDVRGDFRYTFDPNITQPAVVAGGNGGQALGGAPFDVFVAGDAVTLTYSPPPGRPPFLRAFGADFLYAPSFDTIPADTYRLGIADGPAAGMFAGSLDTLDPNGGTFFLGLIAGPAARFTAVTVSGVQVDPTFLVPAFQVDNLTYAAVPEPGAPGLLALGGIALLARLRRRA